MLNECIPLIVLCDLVPLWQSKESNLRCQPQKPGGEQKDQKENQDWDWFVNELNGNTRRGINRLSNPV